MPPMPRNGLIRISLFTRVALLVAGSAGICVPKAQGQMPSAPPQFSSTSHDLKRVQLAQPSHAAARRGGSLPRPNTSTADAAAVIGRSRSSARAALPATTVTTAQGQSPNLRLVHQTADSRSVTSLDKLKETIRLARRGKTELAIERSERIRDRAGRKLAEWVILRSDDDAIDFERYASFIRDNPSWPSLDRFRRRAEARLWFEPHQSGTVLTFFSDREPLGTLGKLALARALLERGDRAAARKYVRSAWRTGSFSAQYEAQVLARFGHLLTVADHRARMDSRLYADDIAGALRAANRLTSTDRAIVKARAAVIQGAKTSGALLDAAASAAAAEPAYLSPASSGFVARTALRRPLNCCFRWTFERPLPTMPMHGGSSAASWCADCSTKARRRSLTELRATPLPLPGRASVSTRRLRRAGSRCDF